MSLLNTMLGGKSFFWGVAAEDRAVGHGGHFARCGLTDVNLRSRCNARAQTHQPHSIRVAVGICQRGIGSDPARYSMGRWRFRAAPFDTAT